MSAYLSHSFPSFFFITAVLLVGYLDVSSLISTSVISVYHLLISLSLPLHLSIALSLSNPSL